MFTNFVRFYFVIRYETAKKIKHKTSWTLVALEWCFGFQQKLHSHNDHCTTEQFCKLCHRKQQIRKIISFRRILPRHFHGLRFLSELCNTDMATQDWRPSVPSYRYHQMTSSNCLETVRTKLKFSSSFPELTAIWLWCPKHFFTLNCIVVYCIVSTPHYKVSTIVPVLLLSIYLSDSIDVNAYYGQVPSRESFQPLLLPSKSENKHKHNFKLNTIMNK